MCRCVQACCFASIQCAIFVFWLHLAKTWLWENLETLLPAHLVSLHNALIRPSGSDDNNNLSHDSVSPLICLLSMLSSHSHPLPLIFFVLPVFALRPCRSAVFKWILLQKLVSERSSAASADPLWPFIFLLYVALFFSLYLSFFCCFYSICSAPSTYHGRTNSTHTYTENDTHKTYCSSAKWMAGWESQTLCYSIPANAISGDTVPTREPLRGTEAFSEMQTITQANCYVVPLPSLLLPLQTFFFINQLKAPTPKRLHGAVCTNSMFAHMCALTVCSC